MVRATGILPVVCLRPDAARRINRYFSRANARGARRNVFSFFPFCTFCREVCFWRQNSYFPSLARWASAVIWCGRGSCKLCRRRKVLSCERVFARLRGKEPLTESGRSDCRGAQRWRDAARDIVCALMLRRIVKERVAFEPTVIVTDLMYSIKRNFWPVGTARLNRRPGRARRLEWGMSGGVGSNEG